MTRDYDAVIARIDPTGSRDDRIRAVVEALWEELAGHAVSWVGFYLDQPGAADDRRMILGPCRDRPACSPIGLHGVCGSALVTGEIQIVHDVADLGADYIACDPRDRSEIVIPLLDTAQRCWGVLDLDSFDVGAFDDRDAEGLTRVLVAVGLHVPPGI